MGADLFIRKITEPARKAHEPAFKAAVAARDAGTGTQEAVDAAYAKIYPDDGYFRDSYNATSVLNRMGLSWWQDVVPLLTRAGYLSGPRLDTFIKMLESHPVEFRTAEQLKADHATVDNGENSPEGWHNYMTDKRERLIAFAKRAKSLRCGIYASL